MFMPMSGNCCDLLVSTYSRNIQPGVLIFDPERPLGYGCSSARLGLNQGPMSVPSVKDTPALCMACSLPLLTNVASANIM